MATNTQLSTNVAAAVAALANSGLLKLYDGTQPATSDTAITTQNNLATLTMNATAFTVAGLVLTANAITQDSNAALTGTATWFRLFKSDGTTALLDGNVGTASANLILNSTAIQQHAAVAVSSLVLTLANA